jgi:hypothetical protein
LKTWGLLAAQEALFSTPFVNDYYYYYYEDNEDDNNNNNKDLTEEMYRIWNVKAKVILVNNGGNCNRPEVIHTVPEQHTGKERDQGTTENSHIVHCTHTAEVLM